MNSWSYQVPIPPGTQINDALVRHLLQFPEQLNYKAWNPIQQRIWGANYGTAKSFELQTQDQLVTTLLIDEGGYVSLWNEEFATGCDFSIILHKPGSVFSPGGYSSVYVSFSWTDWFEDKPYRELIAQHAETIFISNCQYLGAPYGCSYDELLWERFDDNTDGIVDALAGEKPTFLYWLQYFSKSYAESVDLETLSELGAEVSSIDKGYLVKFFDRPWNRDLDKLEAINIAWAKQLQAE